MVGAREAADGLVLRAEVEDRVGSVEGDERQAHRAGGGRHRKGVVQAGVQAERAVVDGDGAGEEPSHGAEFHRASVIEDEAARRSRDQRGVHGERGERQDVEVGRASRRTDERTHVEGRRAILNEEAGGVGEGQREQLARGAVLAEDAGGETRGDRSRAAGGQGVDGRRRIERGRGGELGVGHTGDGDGEVELLIRGERAPIVGDAVLGEEARAQTGDGGVAEDVSADGLIVEAITTSALPGREAGVRDAEVGQDIAESGDDEGAVGLDRVERGHTRSGGVGAQEERRAVEDAGDRRVGIDTFTRDEHTRNEAHGARDGHPC